MKLKYEKAEAAAAIQAFDFATNNSGPDIDYENQVVPQAIFDYFFTLQSEIEKNRMDYREYARQIWIKFVSSDGECDTNDPVFQEFQKDMIHGLHNIDQSLMVYEDILENLSGLVVALKPLIKKIILWSKGDIESTGYQVLKIKKCGVIAAFRQALFRTINEDSEAEFRSRTDYMVADDKLAKLRSYLEAKKEKGVRNIKIAVVEDSRSNLDKVKKLVQELFPETGEVILIWAAYSREGRAVAAKAYPEKKFEELTEEDFRKISGEYIPIQNFSEIGVHPQLLGELEGAELLVDFDGVIGDNIKMRIAQAQVKMAALKRAIVKKGLAEKDPVESYLEGKLSGP